MKRSLAALALSSAAVFCTAFPILADDDKKAAICAEAEERYVELFGHPSSEEEGVTVVKMYEYNFCPGELTVPVGTTVRWVNVDKRTSHSVIVPNEPESDRAFPEETIEFTFLTEGDQEYLCGPHWETREMIGMITVIAE
ncbi:plastocyanin/azurin family copper-binding protein [uncultured Aliiroseovarius sp.]|uniref:cupredoxin domain-containing protein n=1 Tax=uncultured Aliiroseovarius sp. TaxID=1658783 RepID=UPI002594D2C8|nr:plastocyanin/azurin family copper-binding protein [uncultured Aliiroseovarius sp.]